MSKRRFWQSRPDEFDYLALTDSQKENFYIPVDDMSKKGKRRVSEHMQFHRNLIKAGYRFSGNYYYKNGLPERF